MLREIRGTTSETRPAPQIPSWSSRHAAAKAESPPAHIKNDITQSRGPCSLVCSLANGKQQSNMVLVAIAALYLPHFHPPLKTVQKGIQTRIYHNHAVRRVKQAQATKPSISKNPDPTTFLAQLNAFPQLIGATAGNVNAALDSPTKSRQGGIPIASAPAQCPLPVKANAKPGKTAITNAFLSQISTGMWEAYLLGLGSSLEEGEVFGISAPTLHGLQHKNMGMWMTMGGTSVQHQWFTGNDNEFLWVVEKTRNRLSLTLHRHLLASTLAYLATLGIGAMSSPLPLDLKVTDLRTMVTSTTPNVDEDEGTLRSSPRIRSRRENGAAPQDWSFLKRK
ncbi:hypothetical protein BKA70DRAFT_1413239 [Coprinopsis sp. MPI-PUGE-AT-0042]|nr:hypothetical protein BKA70DRAFT_1413239 [Coprinopsis sp. MPI-PUGE-AT-0042]